MGVIPLNRYRVLYYWGENAPSEAMMNLPVNHLVVRSFRGLRDLELEGCGAINLLVGGNNSGKTSVLEALLLLASPLDIVQWETAVELRRAWPLVDLKFRRGNVERLDALSWLFPHQDGELLPMAIGGAGAVGQMIATAERISGEPPEQPVVTPNKMVEGWFRRASERERDMEALREPGLSIDIQFEWSEQLKRSEQQIDMFDSSSPDRFQMILWGRGSSFRGRSKPHGPTLPAVFATPISHRSDGYLASRVGRLLRSKERKRHAIELLRTIDPQLSDLVIVTPEESELEGPMPLRIRGATLHVEHAAAGLIPIHALGDGIRRAVYFATLLADAGPGGMVLIDELEVSMHTSVLGDVFQWLGAACRESSVQLFATTHSLEAVDAILEAVPDEDLVLFRLKNGKARRYTGDVLRTARVELGQEVR